MSRLDLPAIPPLDATAMNEVRRRLDQLTKPAGSLGRLEDLATWLAGVQAKALPAVQRPAIFVVAADHGVTARGVSAYDADVTAQMVANFLAGGAAINVLARLAGAEVIVVDAGLKRKVPANPRLISKRIGPGTADFSTGSAMTREQAVRCIQAGVELAMAVEADVVGCGEMGIGNTTSASAITAAMLREPAVAVTGRGTGVDEAGLQRKLAVIEAGLAVNRPDPEDALDVLAKVGGFEVGVLAGIMIGTAASRGAVLVDGFISAAAALLAVGIAPACHDYLLASHLSTEPGHRRALTQLKLEPLLDLRLRLGEGTGAALAIPLLVAACRVLGDMATFDEAGVSEKIESMHE